MQSFDWDDLKHVLALHRAGSLTAAGRSMGTSDTTVARRIKALEARLGAQIFLPGAQDGDAVTPMGQLVLDRAEAMERESDLLAEAVGRAVPGLSETVRISTVPVLSHRVLLPALPELHHVHPDLVIELVPDGRNLDLNKREADLALRFSRPVTGGLKVKAVKLGSVAFEIFGAVGKDRSGPWISYDDTCASLPQARWIESVLQQGDTARAPLRVTDMETALEAAALGLGQTLLPASVGNADPRLKRLAMSEVPPLPDRDVWLLSHVDHGGRRAIEAIKTWLKETRW